MNEIINKPALVTTNARNDEPVLKLVLIENLLNEFHSHDITYCHWKSNEHLDASMTANTDLDILFGEKQKERLEILLSELGFKKLIPISQKQYKDIEDFIGLDFPSGKIVHLHAHFKLTMGEAYLKSYQLNLEDKVLHSRVFDKTYNIYRTNPAFELILLYFRESLKIRNRDIVQMYLKNKIDYAGNILKEYAWLKQRCTQHEIEIMLKKIVANYHPIYNLVTSDFNRKELLKLSVLIKKEFKGQRLYSPLKALILRWYRELSIAIFRKSSRLLNRPVISQRINPRGGLIVAVIGADGSGKSTVIANLQSTFRKKLDVYRIYLGRGRAGGLSWPRKLLAGLRKRFAAAKKKEQSNKAVNSDSITKKGFKTDLFKCIEALIVAREKCRKIKQMHAAKKKGMLVICDRFPQNQVMGFNDGPVLHDLSETGNPAFKAMSKIEACMYKYVENNPPCIVFKLIAEAKVIQARKPSMASTEMLEAKVEGIKNLQFAEGCRVITIDATQPLDKVLFAIKREIWDAYP